MVKILQNRLNTLLTSFISYCIISFVYIHIFIHYLTTQPIHEIYSIYIVHKKQTPYLTDPSNLTVYL